MLPAALASLLLWMAPLPQEAEVQNMIPENVADAWHGNLDRWTIENGELIGRTTEPLARTEYLFWNGQASDFELRFEYRIRGGNSGMQYRSVELPGGDVAGYQADIEDGPNYTGILYETGGRGIAAKRGEALRWDEEGKREVGASLGAAADLQSTLNGGGWNAYRIVAIGGRLVHEINGVRMVDVVDHHPKHARSEGVFCVQLHSGPPMEIRFRNMTLVDRTGTSADDLLGAWKPASQAGENPEWIWTAANSVNEERRWFLYPFELKQSAEVVGGLFAGDNHHRVYLDGRPHGGGDDWSRAQPVPTGMKLEPGWHALAVEAWNDGGIAGLVGRIDLQLADGNRRSLRTSGAWKVFGEAPEGWPTPDLDALPESMSIYSFGPTGGHSGPWGNVMAPKVAPAPESIRVAPGFLVERLYSAQHGEGSWVSMTFGPEGQLFLSPQSGPLMKFDVSRLLGAQLRPAGPGAAPGAHVADLEPPTRISFPVRNAQGLEWAYDSLYVNVVAPADQDGGFHRISDSDGDGRLDHHEHLVRFGPPTEHGVHGIRLGPDGALYVINGNYVRPPTDLDGNSVLVDDPVTRTEEDVLLERHWDPRGHAHGIMAPAGVLYRTDAEGKQWERISIGTRNCYDIAISASGEIFTYDADMEWDLGMPWYRSPRVLHLIPGGEYGWRSGSAKWPEQYPDSLPPVLETDLSSPVGVELGEGSAFPERYQQALFLGDWAWGRITVAMLEPNGASYSGRYEDFLQGRGVTVTDLEFGPDGNLWFIIGGRGTQSGLYRVRSIEPNANPSRLADPPLLAERHALESMSGAGDEVVAALTHEDRTMRYLARLAIERAGAEEALMLTRMRSTDARAPLAAGLAALRAGAEIASDAELARLLQVDPPVLEAREEHWLALRSAMYLAQQGSDLSAFAAKMAAGFPTGDAIFDQELARCLTAVDAIDPGALFPFLGWQFSQEIRIHYGLLLAELAGHFDVSQAVAFLMWEKQMAQTQGGASAGGFIRAIGERARGKMSEDVRASAEEAMSALTVEPAPPLAPVGREHVQDWTLQQLSAALNGQTGDAERGSEVFAQALCIQCHRVAGNGGALGPDLTASTLRFSQSDLLEAILDPAKDRTDQYGNLMMPEGLLDTFTASEVADLMAYLEAAAR